MRRFFALTAAVLVTAFFMGTAHAQLACSEKSPSEELFEKHGEKIVAKALTAPGHLLQIFANLASGTYTMVWCRTTRLIYFAWRGKDQSFS